MKDFNNARERYQLALSFTRFLPEDGYGNMIKGGITSGLERVKNLGVEEIKRGMS